MSTPPRPKGKAAVWPAVGAMSNRYRPKSTRGMAPPKKTTSTTMATMVMTREKRKESCAPATFRDTNTA